MLYTKNYITFELYLEGVKVPTFNSLSIAEEENSLPAAQIDLPATTRILRILPGTVVMIFCKEQDKDSYLLFEGELSTISFQLTPNMSSVSLKAISLLGGMLKTRLRPAHALVTNERSNAEMINDVRFFVTSDNSVEDNGNEVNSSTMLAPTTTVNGEKGDEPHKVSFTGKLNELSTVSEFGTLADTLAQALSKNGSQISEGNFIEFLKEIQKFYHSADIYYGINSVSYKIPCTQFAFPNPDSIKGFQMRVCWEAINNMVNEVNKDPAGNNEQHVLYTILNQFKQYMYYKSVAPASFPAVQMFHIPNNTQDYKPLREIYLPNFESAPPMLCNVFFPEQVSSISFTRDLLSEPTRMIGELSYAFLEKGLPANLKPLAVVPDVNISQPDKKRLLSQYTDEECYRGVVLKVSEYDGTTIKAIYKGDKIITTGKHPDKDYDKKSLPEDVQTTMREFILNDYLNLKYGSRAATINCDWSPYRFIGMPAMAFKDGNVTLIGTLASISTTITPRLSATSSCTFRNVKVLYDEADKDTIFQHKKTTDTDEWKSYVVSDFANTGTLGINPSSTCPDLYSYSNIGKEIYPYLVEGKLVENSVLYKYFQSQKDNDAKTYLYKKTLESTERIAWNDTKKINDYSILRFIDTDKFSKEMKAEQKNIPLEIYNTRLLYEGVKKFKENYRDNILNNEDGGAKYFNETTFRKLITKNEYTKFLGMENGLLDEFDGTENSMSLTSNWENTCKDSISILQNKSYTMADFQDNVLAMAKHLYTENVDYPTWVYDKKKVIVSLIPKVQKKLKREQKELKALQKTKKSKKSKENTSDTDDIKTKIEKLKEQIAADNDALNQHKNVTSETTVISVRDLKAALYRPFNITRKAHVLEMVTHDIQYINKEFTVIKQ